MNPFQIAHNKRDIVGRTGRPCLPATIPNSFELQGRRREMLYAKDQKPGATSLSQQA